MHPYLLIIIAYLVGSIPTGKWVCRMKGVDIQSVGSGNTGATNVNRALGLGWAVPVALFDVAKSLIPTYIALISEQNDLTICAVATAAALGHVFSLYLGFHGGKAVSTYIGALLALIPVPTALWLLVWVIAIRLVNIMSLVNLIMLLIFIPVLFVVRNQTYAIWAVVMWLLVAYAHRENIKRLVRGEELVIKSKDKE